MIVVTYLLRQSITLYKNLGGLEQNLGGGLEPLSPIASAATGDRPSQWEMPNFDPSESKPMSRVQQNNAQLITSARGPPKPNLVQIHPLGASGHMGEI